MENFPDASIKDCDLGPDHVQLTLLNWRPKVNWKNFSTKFRKYFPIHFAYTESCALSKVNWNQHKSIGNHTSQLELTKKAEKYSYTTYHMISPQKNIGLC